MKKISEVQAARKAYNALSKKEKDTIKKDVSTLTKAETLIKQNKLWNKCILSFFSQYIDDFWKRCDQKLLCENNSQYGY